MQVVAKSVQKTIQVLIQAGFVVNLKKSKLVPTQDLVYIGARFRMDLSRLYLPHVRIQTLITCVGSFSRLGAYKPAHQFLRLQGLMAATLQSVEYAHLCKRRVASSCFHQRGSCPRAQLVVGQAAPVLGNAVYISHHHYYYGCEHGGVGGPLYRARVRYSFTVTSGQGKNASSTSTC